MVCSPGASGSKQLGDGTVALDAARVGRDAGKIADEVIAHLSGLLGAEVKVTLEIAASVPDGAPVLKTRPNHPLDSTKRLN